MTGGGRLVAQQGQMETSRNDIIKALLDNQKEENLFVRHYEETRFKVTQLTITLSGLLIGALRFVEAQKNTNRLFGAFIIILGVLGALISAKYTERADRHAELSRTYRRTASKLIGNIGDDDFEKIHVDAVARHAQKKRFTNLLQNVRARLFWVGIHICMIALGVIVAIF
jgi:hypothetical protein